MVQILSLFGPLAATILTHMWADKVKKGQMTAEDAAKFIKALENNVNGYSIPAKLRDSSKIQDVRLSNLAAQWDKEKENNNGV